MDSTDTGQSLKALLEGLIFTSGEEGLSLIQIQSVLDWCDRRTLSDTLEEMAEETHKEERGVELVRFGGRWKYVAKASIYPFAQRLYSRIKNATLSSSALEVLSLVAYRQPITRVEIDEIRGVSSDMTLKKLQARGLVETCGHLDTIGRPLLYQVGEAFFDVFGLSSLDDLPDVQTDQKRKETLEQTSLFDLPEAQEKSEEAAKADQPAAASEQLPDLEKETEKVTETGTEEKNEEPLEVEIVYEPDESGEPVSSDRMVTEDRTAPDDAESLSALQGAEESDE
ncbi:SMC-Scp complex subunit ScpB [Allobaculum mucilyticum]|uniref:SMC-Scp complex subunit ScpB n=1 Tax=Allobaculum mucilyticum TaxID=2834459 RepID=UPI001E360AB6|nr:SMC-Scp complex subunit ScpB [Allobaculum mucilyticum]UNT96322.1 SMC-Scp complex subunit ScpB [Allobaculum mucilyticum]